MDKLPIITLEEVGIHNQADDLWLAVHGYVYNLTSFLEKHPGGEKPLLCMAGKDATENFMKIGKHANINVIKLMTEYCIGRLK